MAGENTVLVLQVKDDVRTLEVQKLTDTTIPKELNGESGFHIYHVRMLTELILRRLQEEGIFPLSDEQIEAMAMASCLHDIGKSQIPRSILDYAGKLSPIQYDIIKKHSLFGEHIIRELEFDNLNSWVKQYAIEIARSHHERYDGTGYPDGLKGEEIPLSAQVVALADSYDALTSDRSYKKAFSQDVAIQMISSGMCGVFDDRLIDCLLRVVNHNSLVALREQFFKKRTGASETGGFVPKYVLCIGNTQYLTEDFIQETFPSSKVMVVGNTELGSVNQVKLFKISKPSIKSIFETYEFDLVIYFSGELTYQSTEKSDSEELREVLKYTKELQKGTKVIFLSSLDSAFKERTDRAILSEAKENLCKFYARQSEIDLKIVQIPYLYSGIYKKDFLYHIFDELHAHKLASIDAGANDSMHFLCLKDLSQLLARLVDNWKSGQGVLTVVDDFGDSFADLRKKLMELEPSAELQFVGESSEKRVEANNRALRNEYGWFAKISILEDLEEEYENYLQIKESNVQSVWDKMKKWFEGHGLFVKVTELIILFIMTEILLHMTDSAVIFSIVDFRMVYIVIMATIHGLDFGLSAAALSSLSWLVAKVSSGTNLMTIFYEPTNWLAFVFFFLVGALCGYVKLRKEDTIRFVSEQNQLLENKLAFTREIYEDTYREKRDLKKQIIGSKDSLGKIFDITRRLDTVEQRLLYLRIMETFEEVLENKSITVYSVNEESTFGRLEVASRDIIDVVSRSISIEMYTEVINVVKTGEIWRNTELRPEIPMYAAGVYRGETLVLLIFLWNANVDQYSLYYVNLFKILCDLVQMSLLRAFDYSQAVYAQQYISGTNIMNADAFKDCLKNYAALSEKKVSTYVLLEIDNQGKTYSEMNAIVSKKVRANDILGATCDGKTRLLLSQATESDLPYILPRFEGLQVEVIMIQ